MRDALFYQSFDLLTNDRNKRVNQDGGTSSGTPQVSNTATNFSSNDYKYALVKDEVEELTGKITALKSKRNGTELESAWLKPQLDLTKAKLEKKRAELEKQKVELQKVTEEVETLEKDYKTRQESFAQIESTQRTIDKDHERLQYSRTVKQDILSDYEKSTQFSFPVRR